MMCCLTEIVDKWIDQEFQTSPALCCTQVPWHPLRQPQGPTAPLARARMFPAMGLGDGVGAFLQELDLGVWGLKSLGGFASGAGGLMRGLGFKWHIWTTANTAPAIVTTTRLPTPLGFLSQTGMLREPVPSFMSFMVFTVLGHVRWQKTTWQKPYQL